MENFLHHKSQRNVSFADSFHSARAFHWIVHWLTVNSYEFCWMKRKKSTRHSNGANTVIHVVRLCLAIFVSHDSWNNISTSINGLVNCVFVSLCVCTLKCVLFFERMNVHLDYFACCVACVRCQRILIMCSCYRFDHWNKDESNQVHSIWSKWTSSHLKAKQNLKKKKTIEHRHIQKHRSQNVEAF